MAALRKMETTGFGVETRGVSTLAESFEASLMICMFDEASLVVDGASLTSLAFAA